MIHVLAGHTSRELEVTAAHCRDELACICFEYATNLRRRYPELCHSTVESHLPGIGSHNDDLDFRAGELKLRRPLCLSFLYQLAGWTLMAQSLAADLVACGFLWPTPESLSLYDALLSDVMSKILPR